MRFWVLGSAVLRRARWERQLAQAYMGLGKLTQSRACIERALALGEGERYDFAPMLAEIRPYIEDADLAFCHVETPMTPDPHVQVVDSKGTLKHVEYVPEIANHPNYDAALNALKACS